MHAVEFVGLLNMFIRGYVWAVYCDSCNLIRALYSGVATGRWGPNLCVLFSTWNRVFL